MTAEISPCRQGRHLPISGWASEGPTYIHSILYCKVLLILGIAIINNISINAEIVFPAEGERPCPCCAECERPLLVPSRSMLILCTLVFGLPRLCNTSALLWSKPTFGLDAVNN